MIWKFAIFFDLLYFLYSFCLVLHLHFSNLVVVEVARLPLLELRSVEGQVMSALGSVRSRMSTTIVSHRHYFSNLASKVGVFLLVGDGRKL